jgi:NAD-dependent DNA ligase
LEKSKTKSLDKIIYALGIPQVGEKTAKVIVDHISEMLKSEDVKRLKSENISDHF